MRERRRARTWDAIHAAASELARKNGIKQTTAELIAERAGVSPRTFFNYFSAKEDAIIGLRTPMMSEEVLESVPQREGGNLLAYAARILMRVLRDSLSQHSWTLDGEIFRENPELRQRMKIHTLRCEHELQEFLLAMDWGVYESTGRLVRREGEEGAPDEHQTERVRATVLMAAAVLRHIRFGAELSTAELDSAIGDTVTLFAHIVKEAR